MNHFEELFGEEEHNSFHYASDAERDLAAAVEYGCSNKDRAWLLSERDVWYKNPYYKGPTVRHPEDDSDCYGGWENAEQPDIEYTY